MTVKLRLSDAASEEILILSRSMEYLPDVADNLKRALERDITLRIVLMNPDLLDDGDREKQFHILRVAKERLGEGVPIRFSDEVPIRGCITDPARGGQALFLVEDPGVPLSMREAAITSHSSVVKGLALMFNLTWEHRSKKP